MGGRLPAFFNFVGDGGGDESGEPLSIGAAFELALVEWHLSPEYLNENWTEELLALMFQKRNERIERAQATTAGESTTARPSQPASRRVTDTELLAQMGINPRRGRA
jgi:hypothetical protein